VPPWLAKPGEAAANTVTSIMAAATSTDTLFLNTSSVLLPQRGGTPQPRSVVQRHHGSKHVVLGASPIWTIFVCQVTIPGSELRRTLNSRTS
jgi:hypothetical protein